jgi:hypothetical protein
MDEAKLLPPFQKKYIFPRSVGNMSYRSQDEDFVPTI